MKTFKDNSLTIILLSIIILIVLFLNLFLETHPVLNFIKYLENTKFYWTIPTSVILLITLWLFDRRMRKKITRERIETYNATIHTLQDIIHKSSSSMQLLVLDLRDEGVHEELINRIETILKELNAVVKVLASVNPENMQLTELNRNLSIIKMHELENRN